MCELVVDGLQVILVKRLNRILVAIDIVDAHEEYLSAALGCSELKRTIVTIVPFALEEEQFREIPARKVNAGHLVVSLDAAVLHDVSHLHSLLILSRYSIIVSIALVELVAILHFDVVWLKVVHLEPLVERRLLHHVCSNNRLRRKVVITTSCESQCCSRQQERIIYISFHTYNHFNWLVRLTYLGLACMPACIICEGNCMALRKSFAGRESDIDSGSSEAFIVRR